MFAVQLAAEFEAWLDGMQDKKAPVRISIVLLNGGDKSTQTKDIKRTQQILNELESEL